MEQGLLGVRGRAHVISAALEQRHHDAQHRRFVVDDQDVLRSRRRDSLLRLHKILLHRLCSPADGFARFPLPLGFIGAPARHISRL